jgi:large subunit ribosomal protein L18Ae
MHEYVIYGRRKPSEKFPAESCPVYRMRLFASDSVIARSRFWYYLSLLRKVKKANGEIVAIHEIFEKNPNYVKNFGFWLRYDSRSGTHNMYKEYRDVTLTGAVNKMYADLASRHRARRSSIQIIRTQPVAAKDSKRPSTQQFHDSQISFKLLHRVPRASHKMYKKTFRAERPSSFF